MSTAPGHRSAAPPPAYRRWRQSVLLFLLSLPALAGASADFLADPGNVLLRHDLELLNDAGEMNLPLTSWPIPWHDISRGLNAIDPSGLGPGELEAFNRLSERYGGQPGTASPLQLSAGVAENPRVVRGFEAIPREDAQAGAAVSWAGDRVVLRLAASVAADPLDGDELRPDGSYLGLAVGNWMLSAGWQERWWGPGRDGSLILSTNARPSPGLAFNRNSSAAFRSKWLSWIGPWSLGGFMTQLDDDRAVQDARLFGLRFAFKPLQSLEIGLSRTAQWCGEGRPCDFSTFTDLLFGNDNRGVNVDPDDEPGNQLAGIDLRWRLPRRLPVALYLQWIGEDTRRGGPEIGSWLRQAGIEHWGRIGGSQHRTHFEFSDTECREGGLGFSEHKPNCAYEHSLYPSGYRYGGRAIGHGADGDSRMYSFGSTLVRPDGHTWSLSLRYAELNRSGPADARHSLSPTPRDLADILLTHERRTGLGRFRIGLGYSRLDDDVGGTSSEDFEAFLTWSTH